jgi:hypothetical protein
VVEETPRNPWVARRLVRSLVPSLRLVTVGGGLLLAAHIADDLYRGTGDRGRVWRRSSTNGVSDVAGSSRVRVQDAYGPNDARMSRPTPPAKRIPVSRGARATSTKDQCRWRLMEASLDALTT